MGTVATLAVVVASVGLNPQEGIAAERVDLIEVNHFFDEHGKLVFDQVIFYDWCDDQARYNVRAWRLLKKPSQLPKRNWNSGDYVAIWHDGELLREVRAPVMRETWTQHDPELIEREYLAKEKRVELFKIVAARKPVNVARNRTPPRTADNRQDDPGRSIQPMRR